MALSAIFGGWDQPRVVFLDANGNTKDTVDMDFTNADNDLVTHCMRDENPEKIITTKVLVDGSVHEKFGGFRFRARYEWPLLDETSRDVLAAILNHPNHIKWYPHQDLLTIHFECIVTGGDIYNMFKVGGIDRAYHRGFIELTGVNVIPFIPSNLDYVHVTADDVWGTYSPAEQAVAFSVDDGSAWSTFSAAERRRVRITTGSTSPDLTDF